MKLSDEARAEAIAKFGGGGGGGAEQAPKPEVSAEPAPDTAAAAGSAAEQGEPEKKEPAAGAETKKPDAKAEAAKPPAEKPKAETKKPDATKPETPEAVQAAGAPAKFHERYTRLYRHTERVEKENAEAQGAIASLRDEAVARIRALENEVRTLRSVTAQPAAQPAKPAKKDPDWLAKALGDDGDDGAADPDKGRYAEALRSMRGEFEKSLGERDKRLYEMEVRSEGMLLEREIKAAVAANPGVFETDEKFEQYLASVVQQQPAADVAKVAAAYTFRVEAIRAQVRAEIEAEQEAARAAAPAPPPPAAAPGAPPRPRGGAGGGSPAAPGTDASGTKKFNSIREAAAAARAALVGA